MTRRGGEGGGNRKQGITMLPDKSFAGFPVPFRHWLGNVHEQETFCGCPIGSPARLATPGYKTRENKEASVQKYGQLRFHVT